MNTVSLKKVLWQFGSSLPFRPLVKRVVLSSYTNLVRPLPRLLLRLTNQQRVVVLVYHRVNDNLHDAVTVGVKQFDAQMEFIRTHYPVARIEDIVRGNIPRNTSRPLIAVTFDDGYLDNFENAAPILVKHKIPAAFFVCTRLVGSEQALPHDLRRLGKAIPVMNWEHLRKMRDMGFTIGSHSASHIDFGTADLTSARSELIESRDTLRRELGVDNLLFAYPYGGRQNITPEVLSVVRDTGYIGCLSAYGGYNSGVIDPFNILRVGVDDRFDSVAFRARLEGYQLTETLAV